jgi:hypothetical protein
MIRLEDRQDIAQAVEQAHKAGARLKPACELDRHYAAYPTALEGQ